MCLRIDSSDRHDMSTVSRHLAILRNAGIVDDEKHGTQVFYRLSLNCVRGFLTCVDSVLKSSAEEQAKLLSR